MTRIKGARSCRAVDIFQCNLPRMVALRAQQRCGGVEIWRLDICMLERGVKRLPPVGCGG